MNKICFLLVLLVGLSEGGFANSSFNLDQDVPPVHLTDTTQFTLLNARYGSQFSFSYVFRDNGIHTGALGYDRDAFNELLIGIETAEGKYCFRTAKKPEGYQYFLDQKLELGLTASKMTGHTENGIKVSATLVSPFTVSDALQDTTDLKLQIAPSYYLLVDLVNNTGKKVTITLKTGVSKILTGNDKSFGARVWQHGAENHELYFRDNASIHTDFILAAMRNKKQKHFNSQGLNGLKRTVQLDADKRLTDTLIWATYYDKQVIKDRKYNTPLRFYYTKFWNSAKDVLSYSRQNAAKNIAKSQQFENLLRRSDIQPKEKWVIATSFHSDVANTYLLLDQSNNPRFYLAEGRFKHLSTIDVAHETGIMAMFTPWRLKIQLNEWMDYMATEEVDRGTDKYGEEHIEGMSASEYGPYLFHDVGDLPHLSKTSDYWFGPHMAAEENCNYTLLLYWYWKLTGDDAFVKSKLGMVDVLLYSVMNRDTDDNGIVDMGLGWTTYDVADVLKRAPENVFLGVKQMSAYIAASEMFSELYIPEKDEDVVYKDVDQAEDGKAVGFEKAQLSNEKLRKEQAEKYTKQAELIASTLQEAYDKYGYLPVSLEEDFKHHDAHSIVLGEGLMLLGLSGNQNKVLQETATILKESYQKAFKKSKRKKAVNLTTLGAGSAWFSKGMASDMVAGYWYDLNPSTAHYAYDWNKNNYYAYNDGVKQDGKNPWIGFWYPRGIISLGYLLREKEVTAPHRDDFLQGIH